MKAITKTRVPIIGILSITGTVILLFATVFFFVFHQSGHTSLVVGVLVACATIAYKETKEPPLERWEKRLYGVLIVIFIGCAIAFLQTKHLGKIEIDEEIR